MIDTIRFEINGRMASVPDSFIVTDSQSTRLDRSGEKVTSSGKRVTDEETGVRLIGFNTEEKFQVTHAELSVPRLIHGANLYELKRNEFTANIETMKSHVAGYLDERDDELFGKITRIDAVKQFRVDAELVIASHSQAKHPAMRKTQAWFGESVNFVGKERRLRLYDKAKEAFKINDSGPILRAEMQLRGTAIARDLKFSRIDSLDFESIYQGYRAQVIRLQPVQIPRTQSWYEFLAMLDREGVEINGIPAFKVWAAGKSRMTVYRAKKALASYRPDKWHWDWSEKLPENSAEFIDQEFENWEMLRFSSNRKEIPA